MIKIFSPHKTIYLIDNQTFFKKHKNSVIVPVQSRDEMISKYNELIKENSLNEIYFFNENSEKLLKHFTAMFRVIEAAGGLVKNGNGEWLFIFRNGKWDLPKGKIEKKEGVEEAATREVEEECGIDGLKIIKKLTSTYHIYFMEEKAILKKTYWFEMNCNDESTLIPQTEEGITDVKWIAPDKLAKVFANTYESVKEVIEEMKLH
ncbi:MAG: NUDIX domain-containing protein [Bacteroidota bacterium]